MRKKTGAASHPSKIDTTLLKYFKRLKKILPFLVVFFVSLIMIYPTFRLALFGDDWLIFWEGDHLLRSNLLGHWNYVTLLFTGYGSQVVFTDILRSIFGFQSVYYYFTSFVFRTLAAFSLYPLSFYLTKNRISAFVAMVFFSVTSIGLETSDYTVHTASYIAVSFLSFFLYFLFRSHKSNSRIHFFLTMLFFFLFLVAAPIRATGVIPIVILIEFFWFTRKRSFLELKKTLLRTSILLAIFLILLLKSNLFTFVSLHIDQKPSPTNMFITRTLDNLKIGSNQIRDGNYGFLFYPVATLGSMVIPDTVISGYSNLLLIYIVFLIFAWATSILNYKFIIISGFLTFGVNLVYLDKNLLLPPVALFLIGIYMLLAGISLISFYRKKNYISISIFTSLCIAIFGFIFPWSWNINSLFPTTHRYLIISATGISILIAVCVSLATNTYKRISVFCLVGIVFVCHFISSSRYITGLVGYHNQVTVNKIWAAMPSIPDLGKTKKPLVIYLEDDGTNTSIMHHSFGFGLGFHLDVINNTNLPLDMVPVMFTNWNDLVSAVKDGESMKVHGLPAEPVNVENIYAFHLEGQDKLVNITQVTRQRLENQLYSY